MNPKLSRRRIARAIAAKLLAEPARTSHWLKVLAAYLVEQNRVEEIDLIVNDLARELHDQSGHLLVDVTSARPLGNALRSELRTSLKAATGASVVELSEHTDPSLLGGLIARTPDGVMDVTVRHQLKQLGSLV